MTKATLIRCAIYTRKSTDEGLDQDFNSLDAQREACTAYIASQRHEGWRLVREHYDDGGVSGGTLERPALRRLLADIDAGRIGMVVVYKIDRLTRSLTDFSKLVERLDAAGCSFVSVTQAFNTSTSMGRLTLNVLLSFAQFEREVTAERIRDKIAASKKKGMWMGGLVPLGYDKHPDPKTRGLVVNDQEAEAVRMLFRLYDNHACLRTVSDEAARLGIRSKHRVFAGGRTRGGGAFSRGQIHFLLTNPIYIGRIRHKDQSWPGQHAAIVDEDLWNRVQEKLQAASARPRGRSVPTGSDNGVQGPSPLAGRLRDETGDLMTPTHTTRRGCRYRYYVSNRLVAGKETAGDAGGWRLPAPVLERAVAGVVAEHIETMARRQVLLMDPDARTAGAVKAKAGAVCFRLREGNDRLLRDLITSGEIGAGQIRITLAPVPLAAALDIQSAAIAADVLTITAPFERRRRGVEARIVAGGQEPQPDPALMRRLADAHRWVGQLRNGVSLSSISCQVGHSDAYVRTRSQLAFLSPRIQAAIIAGTQPPELCLERILRTGVPLDWDEQERIYGIGGQAP